jgi:hypothetical protein
MRGWIRARSVAEGLKTEIYSYLMRAGPYRKGDALETLEGRTRDILDAVADIASLVAGVGPAKNGPPASDTITADEYLKQRVELQIHDYYEKHAETEQRIVSLYRIAEVVLAILGAGLAAWAGFTGNGNVSHWAAVVTTAIAALAANLAAGRHEYQVTTYTATALRLKRLSSRFRDRHPPGKWGTPDEIDSLVTECEAAISVENQGWMAQWQQRTQAPPQAPNGGAPAAKKPTV